MACAAVACINESGCVEAHTAGTIGTVLTQITGNTTGFADISTLVLGSGIFTGQTIGAALAQASQGLDCPTIMNCVTANASPPFTSNDGISLDLDLTQLTSPAGSATYQYLVVNSENRQGALVPAATASLTGPIVITGANFCGIGGIGADYAINSIFSTQDVAGTYIVTLNGQPEHTTISSSSFHIGASFNPAPAGNLADQAGLVLTITNPSDCRSMAGMAVFSGPTVFFGKQPGQNFAYSVRQECRVDGLVVSPSADSRMDVYTSILNGGAGYEIDYTAPSYTHTFTLAPGATLSFFSSISIDVLQAGGGSIGIGERTISIIASTV